MSDMVLTLDPTARKRKMNPVHGVGNGPSGYPFASTRAREFREAGIPFSRTHDTQGNFGSGEFINIHCIFRDFDADVNDPASYNFALTDIYIQHILEAGTQVYYRLGETIENNPMGKLCPRYIIPPKDFFKWAQICEHIIRHYTEGWANGFHYDIAYWEIWNEPDNPKMWTGTPQQFYEMYKIAATHLKKCFPHLKIGGAAFSGFYAATRDNPSEWFKTLIPFAEGFMEYITASETPVPLDFFSWHCYTHSVDELQACCKYARNFIDKYGFTETESILNEWNYALNWNGAEGKFRKSMTAAAMAAGSLATMQNEGVDAGMYYDAEVRRISFCGLFNEYTAACEKPYYALYAFNQLYKLGTQLETGFENGNGYYAIAAADGKNAAALLVNYASPKRSVTLKTKGCGTAMEVYLLDKTHDLEPVATQTSPNGHFTLELDTDSVILVKF